MDLLHKEGGRGGGGALCGGNRCQSGFRVHKDYHTTLDLILFQSHTTLVVTLLSQPLDPCLLYYCQSHTALVYIDMVDLPHDFIVHFGYRHVITVSIVTRPLH